MAFPDWLLGSGITTIQITAQEFSGGVLVTPLGQVPVDFFTVVDRIGYEHRVTEIEVSPTNSRQENWVTLTTGGHWTITEIMRRTASGLLPPGGYAFNSLAELMHNFDYFRITFTRAGRTYVQFAKGAGYEEEFQRGPARATARFSPAGIVGTGFSRNPSLG